MQIAHQEQKLPKRDEAGLLLNPDLWDELLAVDLAHYQGITQLNDEHWKVIFALRDYYNKYGVAPAMKSICHTEHHDERWVHDLFGNCLNAWIVAGLPDPGEEAKTYLSDSY
ncbi:MAG: TusE/DsrC/DsvC family sulfur relay protein [Gammaproteobacteria bacterium]|nr:TusE/DsrC/DsvC family sulfur relay protein [Gammaproteobacteria bacterium]